MGREAAFFDLDRTLLRGASGPVISDALKQVGLMRDRSIPGEALVYRIFNLVGESRPTMQLARQAARFAQGWAREQAQEAGKIAAETLADAVQPFAAPLIDEHHKVWYAHDRESHLALARSELDFGNARPQLNHRLEINLGRRIA